MRILTLIVLIGLSASLSADVPGLRVPDGFEVRQFAGPELATDITCMTIDDAGRVLVSGPGYVRELRDRDQNGVAESVETLLDGPKEGAHGLLVHAGKLWVVGDGGLWEHTAKQGKLRIKLRTGGEHTSHAIRVGPDGNLYWLGGDGAGVPALKLPMIAPSPQPTSIGGCLLQLSPQGEPLGIVAHGFRNPYGFDINSRGEIYTYDSDNERCVSLPWYEPTRFYRVIPGGYYGWCAPNFAQTWRMPPYFSDVQAPIANLERGSPTGVACYRHTAFPAAYHDGSFAADWTFGRIWFIPRDTGTPSRFVEATGDFGFAPTALAVHPQTGELFISVGGRGTRGAVYAIRAKSPTANAKAIPFAVTKIATTPAPRQLPDELAELRRIQRMIGDIGDRQHIGTVWEGYTRRELLPLANPDIDTWLTWLGTHADPRVRREAARTLAMLRITDLRALSAMLAQLSETSDPLDDIHYLICAGCLPVPRTAEQSRLMAHTLLMLDTKLDSRDAQRDRNWPQRMRELTKELTRLDPRFSQELLGDRAFGHPEHVLYVAACGLDRATAARRFIERSRAEGFTWNAALIELLTALSLDEARPVWRQIESLGGWSDAVVPLLARNPDAADVNAYIAGLRSSRLDVVGAAATALKALPNDQKAWPELIRAMRRLTNGKSELGVRAQMLALLQQQTKQMLGDDPQRWSVWLEMTHPKLAMSLQGGNYDANAWKTRLTGINWDAGDAARGKRVFEQTSCIACHGANQRLGPDLAGVTKRFARDDVFTAILDPSRDISNRYQAIEFEMADGKLHVGMVVYEAVDGVLLQTGTGTIRLDGRQIESRRVSRQSLMPSGLIDRSSDEQLADLYAYLRSLK